MENMPYRELACRAAGHTQADNYKTQGLDVAEILWAVLVWVIKIFTHLSLAQLGSVLHPSKVLIDTR
jgi:hypothetical protein